VNLWLNWPLTLETCQSFVWNEMLSNRLLSWPLSLLPNICLLYEGNWIWICNRIWHWDWSYEKMEKKLCLPHTPIYLTGVLLQLITINISCFFLLLLFFICSFFYFFVYFFSSFFCCFCCMPFFKIISCNVQVILISDRLPALYYARVLKYT